MTSTNNQSQRCRIRIFHNVELGVILRNGKEYFCLTQLYDRLWPNTSRMTTFNRIDRLKCQKLSCTLDELNMLKGIKALGSTATRTTLLPTDEVERLYNYTQDKIQRRKNKQFNTSKRPYSKSNDSHTPNRKRSNFNKRPLLDRNLLKTTTSKTTRKPMTSNGSVTNHPKMPKNKPHTNHSDAKCTKRSFINRKNGKNNTNNVINHSALLASATNDFYPSNQNGGPTIATVYHSNIDHYDKHHFYQNDDDDVFSDDELSFNLDQLDDEESSEGSILTTSSFLLGLQSATSISSDDDEGYTHKNGINHLQSNTIPLANNTTRRGRNLKCQEFVDNSGKSLQPSVNQDKEDFDNNGMLITKEDKVMKDVIVIRKDKSSRWLVSSRQSSQSEEEDVDNKNLCRPTSKRLASTTVRNNGKKANRKRSRLDSSTHSSLNIRIRREGSSVSVISSHSSNSSYTDCTTGASLISGDGANDSALKETNLQKMPSNNPIHQDDSVKTDNHSRNTKKTKRNMDILPDKTADDINYNSQVVGRGQAFHPYKKNMNNNTITKKSTLASWNRKISKSNFSIQSVFNHSFPKLTVQNGDLCPADKLSIRDDSKIEDDHPILSWEVGKEVLGNRVTSRRKKSGLISRTKLP
ncbi:SKI/DACH domain-containing protein 1 [Trichoplax sp. H2]|nr:SKI/DACH domain-containing protein 1 [Trichoplax sp. H2]|eukprot:RDD42603.1 SKI/DACH domain-containing protein 1 [Trichoplax sp. H2]